MHHESPADHTLHRTDGLLPPSFDLVVLGKKEVESVRSVGRNPFRREDDVIDGRAINTLFPPVPADQEPGRQEPLELLQQEVQEVQAQEEEPEVNPDLPEATQAEN